jgi:hypothetical protein
LSTKRQDLKLYFARNQTIPTVLSSGAIAVQVLLMKETHSTSPSSFAEVGGVAAAGPQPYWTKYKHHVAVGTESGVAEGSGAGVASKESRSTVELLFESKTQPKIETVWCLPR